MKPNCHRKGLPMWVLKVSVTFRPNGPALVIRKSNMVELWMAYFAVEMGPNPLLSLRLVEDDKFTNEKVTHVSLSARRIGE